MLNAKDMKALVVKLVADLPPEAILKMTTFVPKVGANDVTARPVFAILLADTSDDLTKCMEVLGYGLARAVGLSGQAIPVNEPLVKISRTIN